MSGLDELDRPGTPTSPGTRDETSARRLTGEDAEAVEDRGRADDGSSPQRRTDAPSRPRPGPAAAASREPDPPAESGAALPPGAPLGSEPPVPQPAAPLDSGASRRPGIPRRGAADPVKALMHRHRELCERAVDPLEIAAALEAHGITDRTAARFRHRDVFSLAEEMYARVPRDGGTAPGPAAPGPIPRARADWALLGLLPGALCAATVVGLRHTQGQTRLTVVLAGVLAVVLALRAALRRGPLSRRGRTRPGPHRTGGRTCWLLAYAALGDGLLRAAADGGPDGLPTGGADGTWPVALAPLVTLACACVPAAWSAHLLAVRVGRRLNASRGLAEFTASARPLLLGTFTLFLAGLGALTGLCAAALDEPAEYAEVLTLGALLFLARLLAVHGVTHAPALVLGAAGAAEAIAPATVFAGRLPGCGFLATPVDALLAAWGPAGVPTLCCGAAALALLGHATRTLTRASAHAGTDQPC
ncbi:hypothetical protein ACH4F6_10660 [Streptomyces sp. NPDC017936]|uniref:hypothetical protein n=1 Tax=Streptomyces sp. NPDC017936 TaxID=3365016 RepID=UPI0037A5A469